MIQQEGLMQDVDTFADTDQCQLPEYGPYSYICKSTSAGLGSAIGCVSAWYADGRGFDPHVRKSFVEIL